MPAGPPPGGRRGPRGPAPGGLGLRPGPHRGGSAPGPTGRGVGRRGLRKDGKSLRGDRSTPRGRSPLGA
ncbi:MAG: hypothetical protein DRJ42_19190 [Deltaproteobacteria bacterium]|nr:MAG: hypothetical protein DRJ42_19190 [Deltaproteobacteria bacterium]